MKFQGNTLAILSAAALGVAISAPSHAYVMSGSVVEMTNFQILGSDGDPLVSGPGGVGPDFSFLTFTSSADYSVALSGFTTLDDNSTSAPIDFPPICLGAGCSPITPDNSFPKLTAPPVVGNYSAADQEELGAPVDGLPGFPLGADVKSGSYVGLDTGSAVGSANSNNNLNSSFVFTLTQDTGITFDFDVDAFLQVALTSDEDFPGFATASYQMDFTIVDLGANSTIYTFAPDLFGDGTKSLSLNAPLPIDIENVRDTGGPISFSDTTPTLTAGSLYQLSARIQTNADAQRVPAPGALALLAVGLLGLASVRRRKQIS